MTTEVWIFILGICLGVLLACSTISFIICTRIIKEAKELREGLKKHEEIAKSK